MNLNFGYGHAEQSLEISDKQILKVLYANQIDHQYRDEEAVQYALDHPMGAGLLRDSVRQGMKVAIVASDISRPVPSSRILPSILKELRTAGIPYSDISVVFALGSHRRHTEEEKEHLAGEEVYRLVHCEDSVESGFRHLGTTDRGTPVDVCLTVADADFVICTGNVEFHYFAGYSGGYKAIMPGCSTVEAIRKNHTAMTSSNAHSGKIEGNPVREDIEAAGKICGVDYIVNVVLDEHKNIVYAAAGDAIKAHRDACAYLDRMYRCRIPQKADIVIVSQGGAPKDANLYQVQKALENAKHAVKEGGTIILIGECPEGFGSKVFEEWFMAARSPRELSERIGREFVLGGHKAAAIGKVEMSAEIILVSKMDPDTVRRIFMKPAEDLQSAWKMAIEKQGTEATVIAMPFGGATLPVCE